MKSANHQLRPRSSGTRSHLASKLIFAFLTLCWLSVSSGVNRPWWAPYIPADFSSPQEACIAIHTFSFGVLGPQFQFFDAYNLRREPAFNRWIADCRFLQIETGNIATIEWGMVNCYKPDGAELIVGNVPGTCDCPQGKTWTGSTCVANTGSECPPGHDGTTGECLKQGEDPKGNGGCPPGGCPRGTNPIDPGSGKKFAREVIYRTSGPYPIELAFSYNSPRVSAIDVQFPYRGNTLSFPWTGDIGPNWIASHLRLVSNFSREQTPSKLSVQRPDGKILIFKLQGGGYVSDPDVSERLTRLTTSAGDTVGWRIVNPATDESEIYDWTGSFLAVKNRQGLQQKVAYADGTMVNGIPGVYYSATSTTAAAQGNAGSVGLYTPPVCTPPSGWVYQFNNAMVSTTPQPGRVLCLEDSSGRQVQFQYNAAGRLVAMSDAANQLYRFEYGGASAIKWNVGDTSPGMLTRIIFPDNTSRDFYYNEVASFQAVDGCQALPASGLPRHLTGIVDENSNRYSTWKYDSCGRGISSEHANGTDKVTLTYDASGSSSVTQFTGPSGATQTTTSGSYSNVFGVARMGQLSGRCIDCGSFANTTYDTNGNIASRLDWKDNKTCYGYELDPAKAAFNLETRRIEGLASSANCAALMSGPPVFSIPARMISTEWSADWRLPTKVAESLRITTYTYGPPTASNSGDRGNVLTKTIQATTDASGALGVAATPTGTARTWTYTYDTFGQVLSVNGPRTDVADVTTYSYYPNTDSEIGRRGNVASVTNALGHVTQITAYNAHGQPLTVVDPNGLTTQLTYDNRQRLKSRNVGGEVTVYDYDPVGQLIKATLPDSSFVSYGYDAAHRMTGISDNLGNRIAYTLDLRGNRTKEEVFDPANALAQTRSRVYDALNRMVQSIGAQNQVTSYTYDPQGNLIMLNDPLMRMTTNAYDALNRLVAVTQPGPGANQPNPVISYGYDGQDQLTRVTDPRSLVTNYTMTGLGDATLQVSPDTGTTTRTFDAAGNVATSTDARGKTTIYAYDALNRVLTKRYGGASGTKIDTFRYDEGTNGKGRLTTLVDSSGTTAWTYDLQGRVTSRRQTKAYGGGLLVTTYSYDAAGRLASMVFPSGRTAKYTYDLAGRVSALSIDNTSIVSGITWHPFGQPKAWIWGNSSVASRTFDADGRMRTHPIGGATRTITYDNANRITQLNDGPVNSIQIFSYDDLDRVTGFVASNTSRAYTYDANGNRTNLSIGVNSYNYTTAANSNRLLSSAGPAPTSTFAYDAAGNAVNLGGRTFTYDDSGRISTFVDTMFTSYPSNYIKEIQFNGLGQRVNKIGGYSNNYANTDYAYDEQGRLIGDNQGGSAIREYVYLSDIPIAVLADTPSVVDNGGIGFGVAGTWSSATGSDALGGGYLYRAAGTGANSASWAPSSLPSGGYNVYARWVSNTDRATNATYQVSHLGGVTSVVVNQRERSDQWVFLGSFTLISGAGHKVTLTDNANGVVIADGVKFLPADASSVYMIDTDHLNTPRAVRSQAGTTIWRWDSDPFGDLPPNDDPDGNGLRFSFPLRFPGQYFDAETGLHYNYFRDYDPRTGRYVQSDPIGLAGGINTYSYVNGNPLSYVDPTGENFLGIVGTIGTAVLLIKFADVTKDAYDSRERTPGADQILRDPNVANEAQQGQRNMIGEAGKIGGAGSELIYKNPISSAQKWWDKAGNWWRKRPEVCP